MKWDDKKNKGYVDSIKSNAVLNRWHNRVNHVRRKMSKGAADIFRVIKNHAKWGNKQLWKSREKGKGKQGHKAPKHH